MKRDEVARRLREWVKTQEHYHVGYEFGDFEGPDDAGSQSFQSLTTFVAAWFADVERLAGEAAAVLRALATTLQAAGDLPNAELADRTAAGLENDPSLERDLPDEAT